MSGDGEGKEIKYWRGLKQGDLLSPLVFTLVAEGLSTIIHKTTRAELIGGLKTSKFSVITYLQYANDTILFGKQTSVRL